MQLGEVSNVPTAGDRSLVSEEDGFGLLGDFGGQGRIDVRNLWLK